MSSVRVSNKSIHNSGEGLQQQRRWSLWDHTTSDAISEILQKYKSLAVVGLSSKYSRPSYGVASYMKSKGYRIIAVNPHETSVLGEKAYASLEEVPEPLEIVVIFRRPEFVGPIVEDAIRKGAKIIWMQEGIVNEEAAHRAREAGLEVIQDRCILKEHAKRFVTEGL
jgi:predicted CoA-binding protein